MGCGGSKLDDLPLVNLCRERKELIKAAADHRYALATSHVLYFQSLRDVGEALQRFVEEELVIGDDGSMPDSPVLNLPSDEGKSKRNSTSKSSSPSQENNNDGHLHFETSSESDSVSVSSFSNNHDSPEIREVEPGNSNEEVNYYPYNPDYYWNSNEVNSNMYYMRKSSTAVPSMIYEEPNPAFAHGNYPQYGGMDGYPGGPFGQGFDLGSARRNPLYTAQADPSTSPPPPPPPPQASGWDFLNLFESTENTFPMYYHMGGYGVGSLASSPDSVEVRQREGIPDLEDETEPEQPVKKEAPRMRKEKQKMKENVVLDSGEGTSKAVPLRGEGNVGPVEEKETVSSFDTSTGEEEEEEVGKKKGVTFEVDPTSVLDGESSQLSSLTTLSTYNGTQDIQDAVEEIRSEFEIASGHGTEVAVMLEVGRLSYQSKTDRLKVLSSRIQNTLSTPTLTSSYRQPRQPQRAAARVVKMAKAKYEKSEKDFRMKSGDLSLTLERLYAWEKKLYKEVKDEERLRLMYERQCKKLKLLDYSGAESNKIDATRASIRKFLTKINVSIRTIEAIASRIHKLRDEELQPQITELINGLMRMWKSMLKCHQKQFQAILESKRRILRANTGIRRDSSFQATVNLEAELFNWCSHFNYWIETQKSYIVCLNGWLLRCLLKEQEVTPDGVVPFSPSRVGAPPVFIICNDWCQQMERLSETDVSTAMRVFGLNLHQLWERQDEEQRRRVKAEYLSKDFEKRVRSLRKEGGRLQRERDASSEKSIALSESGVSPLDDLKVDLDSLKKRLSEEKVRHKNTIKQVHEAASNSLQAGLIPVFQALGNFSSEALKACEQVRLECSQQNT
ncbi:hypothetical protein GIB67_004649 [Kingdonia uniflora]|uniref:Uncharacterized protein n=1 Tax=Kingdonia uniflora TaxID=39325 RepID=A0A7J7MDF2_9MAGN|nr:hypothetical protein GIB67_004649 [Kingdonia uniflora]